MIENSADALSYASGAGCTGKYAGNRKTNSVQRRESTGSGETYKYYRIWIFGPDPDTDKER